MPRAALPVLCLTLALSPARAETCRFTGTTTQDGHLTVQTDAREANGQTTLDVTLEFTIHAWMVDYRYLAQEITTWRGPALQSIALNQRSLADGDIKRQQWDLFTRNGPTLEAARVQAKYLADFRKLHPAFAPHWSPATFGQPWLADYPRANPVRRPDLDLPAAATPPLAFAFYWSRFLPPAGRPVSLILPSLKQNKTAALNLAPASIGDGWSRWSTELHHPALKNSPASQAAAWVSPDHHLLQLAFDLHTDWVAGQVLIRTAGCQGVQIDPSH